MTRLGIPFIFDIVPLVLCPRSAGSLSATKKTLVLKSQELLSGVLGASAKQGP